MGTQFSRMRDKAYWEARNPVLRNGEPAFEGETGKLKIGNGVSRWNDLPYQDTAPYTLPESSSTFDLSLSNESPAGTSTENLQARLDGLSGGGTLRMGPGTITLSGRLFIPPNVTLECSGTTIRVPVNVPIINEGRIVGAKIEPISIPLPTNRLSTNDQNFVGYSTNSSNSSSAWSSTDEATGGGTFSATIEQSGGYNGKPALKISNTGSASPDRVMRSNLPVTPGTKYTFIVWVMTSPFNAAASHGGSPRGLWFATNTQAGLVPSGETKEITASVPVYERRVIEMVPAAGETTAYVALYAPNGNTWWSNPIMFEGSLADWDAATAPVDCVLGGELVNCTPSPRAIFRPSVRRWGTNHVATRLSQPRDANNILRATIMGDSIAEGTSNTSWMKLLTNPASANPSLYLGARVPYLPEATDWRNRAMGGSTSRLVLANLAVHRPIEVNPGNYMAMTIRRGGRIPPRVAEMDLAIILVGQNGGSENNAIVDTCCRLLRSSGVDVLLVASNPMNPASENQGADRALAYRRIADAYDCGLADLNTEFRIRSAKAIAGRPGGMTLAQMIGDSVHPTTAGYEIYAKIIGDQLVSALPGARNLPPKMAVLPSVNLRPLWFHQPMVDFDLQITGTVPRSAHSNAQNPRHGWADPSQAAYGTFDLPPETGTWTNFVRTGSDGYVGMSLIVVGNGTNQTFEVVSNQGSMALGTVTVGSSLAGRMYVADVGTWQPTHLMDRGVWIRSTTGGRLIGVLFYEPGEKIRDRNPSTGTIDGLRFPQGTWSLSNYRTFIGNQEFGQLWGSDSENAAAEFDFEGTAAFMRLGGVSQAAGQYQVSIDGVVVTPAIHAATTLNGQTVDAFSANAEPAYTTVKALGLAPGRHTMRVTVVGKNASAVASPGSQGTRRMIVAQIGTVADSPVGYL